MIAAVVLASVALSAGCPATIVRTDVNSALGSLSRSRWVSPHPGPITGVLFGAHTVGGRFAVYAGGRDPATGAAEKVLWVVPAKARGRVGPQLALVWRRGRARVEQRFWPAWSDQTPGVLFPSVLRPPSPGCWLLSVRTGRITGRLTVLVRAGS